MVDVGWVAMNHPSQLLFNLVERLLRGYYQNKPNLYNQIKSIFSYGGHLIQGQSCQTQF